MFANLPLPDPALPVLIAGPTASGKSALALRIAQAQGRAVVNADALQVHDAFRLLTARPTIDDEARAPHRLYGHVPRGADYSVGHWLREVAPLLAQNPVIVGGTGLYLTALTEGLAEIPPTPAAIRARADAILRDQGLAVLLAGLDPATAARIDRQNPARVQRAWEVLHATGRGVGRLAGRHRAAAAGAAPGHRAGADAATRLAERPNHPAIRRDAGRRRAGRGARRAAPLARPGGRADRAPHGPVVDPRHRCARTDRPPQGPDIVG